jgi:hypothetical protein
MLALLSRGIQQVLHLPHGVAAQVEIESNV